MNATIGITWHGKTGKYWSRMRSLIFKRQRRGNGSHSRLLIHTYSPSSNEEANQRLGSSGNKMRIMLEIKPEDGIRPKDEHQNPIVLCANRERRSTGRSMKARAFPSRNRSLIACSCCNRSTLLSSKYSPTRGKTIARLLSTTLTGLSNSSAP